MQPIIDWAMEQLGWSTAYGAERLGVSPRFMRRVRYGHQPAPEGWEAWFQRIAAGIEAEPLPPGWNPEPPAADQWEGE